MVPNFVEDSFLISFISLAFIVLFFIFLVARQIRKKIQEERLKKATVEHILDLSAKNHRLVKAVEASEKSEENLKKALELRNKMIMIFAHDVRCPLRFLADIAFNLKQKPRSTFIECYQNELDVLFLGARGAYAIANDALDWIKSTAASEPFMIHGVPNAIKRVIANHNGQLKEYQIAIHLHLAYPAAVWARAKTLEIVLENLLQNAIKYCEKTIVISLMDLSETHFCLQIYNDGPGLANEEKLKALNEGKAIRQSTGFRSAAGAGIGLLVVREILIDMDGDISFSNDVAGFEVKIKFRKSEANGI